MSDTRTCWPTRSLPASPYGLSGPVLGVLALLAVWMVIAVSVRAQTPTDAPRRDTASTVRPAPDSLPRGPVRQSETGRSWSTDDPPPGQSVRFDPSRRSEGERAAPARMPPKPDVDVPNLIQRYRSARNQMLAQRLLLEGRRGVEPLPLERLPTPSDTLRPTPKTPASASAEEDTTSMAVESVHALRRLERGWFERRFADTGWSFLGSGRYFTMFDTTKTRELRARLQAQFGEPTQELADFDLRPPGTNPPDEYVQFEYWFVVNDSIPVKVMDAGGPRDRGIIVAADQQVREHLYSLRQALLRPLHRPKRAPYVDYWYEQETGRWYRAGYDGTDYFLQRISRWRLEPGRPTIDSDAGPSAE